MPVIGASRTGRRRETTSFNASATPQPTIMVQKAQIARPRSPWAIQAQIATPVPTR